MAAGCPGRRSSPDCAARNARQHPSPRARALTHTHTHTLKVTAPPSATAASSLPLFYALENELALIESSFPGLVSSARAHTRTRTPAERVVVTSQDARTRRPSEGSSVSAQVGGCVLASFAALRRTKPGEGRRRQAGQARLHIRSAFQNKVPQVRRPRSLAQSRTELILLGRFLSPFRALWFHVHRHVAVNREGSDMLFQVNTSVASQIR